MNDLASVLNTLVVVGVVAALAPLIVALLPGPRVPQIVLLRRYGCDEPTVALALLGLLHK